MENKYAMFKVGDILYHVRDMNVGKVVIESIVLKDTGKKVEVTYNVYGYRHKNDERKKIVPVNVSCLVKDLATAKQSALLNLENLTNEARRNLKNLTEETFEPPKKEENDS